MALGLLPSVATSIYSILCSFSSLRTFSTQYGAKTLFIIASVFVRAHEYFLTILESGEVSENNVDVQSLDR